MRGRRIFDHVDPYLAPAWNDAPEPREFVRWCGICFAWRHEEDGRCVECGNQHMRHRVPAPATSDLRHTTEDT